VTSLCARSFRKARCCMSDVNDPLSWVTRAEEDYDVARTSLRRKKPYTHTACFHAQQCAEKYLKVY
jgi:HEPN domain-containing protein